ncbi:hypothetical protein Bestia_00102 [Acinetobacter phage Bestia]|nr:hypothetical protein Bestia_00102 [Acinetobacter phage Bestia]
MANTSLIDGVVLFNSLKNPKFKFESQTRREFTIDLIVSKKDAIAWNKRFKKQQAEIIDNQDFVAKFEMEVPFPEQDEQYKIKVKRPADYEEKDPTTLQKTGRILPIPDKYRPRVLQLVDPETRKCVDITFKDFGVGRGSKVTVQYEERDNGSFGTTARLSNVRVNELVKFETGNSFDQLGEVEEVMENPYAQKATPAPAANEGGATGGDQSQSEVEDLF